MKILRLTVWLAASLLVGAACGASEDEEGARRSGSLRVIVKGASDGLLDDVARVSVELVATDHESRRYDAEATSAPWDVDFSRVVPGMYSATATALDADGEVLFVSSSVPVAVLRGQLRTLILVLDEEDPGVVPAAPRFLWVEVSESTVKEQQSVQISVGSEGQGPLTLHGRFALDACAADERSIDRWGVEECLRPDPDEYGAFSTAVGMELKWTAPTSLGEKHLVLVLLDEEGNRSEVTITVTVIGATGELEVSFGFNLAPQLSLTAHTLNEIGFVRATISATATSHEGTEMKYEFTTDCEGAVVDGSTPPSGTMPSGETVTFTFEIGDEQTRGRCGVAFRAIDSNDTAATHRIALDLSRPAVVR